MKNIRHNILGYVIFGTLGGFLGYAGLRVNNWELWVTLGIVALYGLNQYALGRQAR